MLWKEPNSQQPEKVLYFLVHSVQRLLDYVMPMATKRNNFMMGMRGRERGKVHNIATSDKHGEDNNYSESDPEKVMATTGTRTRLGGEARDIPYDVSDIKHQINDQSDQMGSNHAED